MPTKFFSLILVLFILFGAASLTADLGNSFISVGTAQAQEETPPCSPPLKPYGANGGRGHTLEYIEAIERTANMVHDDQAQHLADQYGLDVLNVT